MDITVITTIAFTVIPVMGIAYLLFVSGGAKKN